MMRDQKNFCMKRLVNKRERKKARMMTESEVKRACKPEKIKTKRRTNGKLALSIDIFPQEFIIPEALAVFFKWKMPLVF